MLKLTTVTPVKPFRSVKLLKKIFNYYVTPLLVLLWFSPAIAQISGKAEGLSMITELVCENKTTQQKVEQHNPVGLTWDCATSGLTFTPGDIVKQTIKGIVSDSTRVGGAVTGITAVTKVKCENKSVEQAINIKPPAPGWFCSDTQLPVNVGDIVKQTIIGSVDKSSGLAHNTLQVCETCHNGVIALGKNPLHIPTNTGSTCDDCHNLAAWLPATLDHASLTFPCSTCHNGTNATGKSANHINSNDSCDSCHLTTVWVLATVDHSTVTGTCMSCHNGTTTMGKPTNHIATADDCGACHAASQWLPALVP